MAVYMRECLVLPCQLLFFSVCLPCLGSVHAEVAGPSHEHTPRRA
jgi:hypothetical protein